MNQTQKMVRWIAVGIVICGIASLALGLRIEPSGLWGPLGMMAAFFVGIPIAQIIREKLDKPCKQNYLQKKAWTDLVRFCFGFIVGGISILYLIHNAEKRMNPVNPNILLVMLVPIIVLGAWVAIGPYIQKKRILNGLDERERLIYLKAKMISDSITSGLSVAFFMGLPVWYGLKTEGPTYIPLCAFMVIAFLAEIAKPLIILVQCQMEQTEGGAA